MVDGCGLTWLARVMMIWLADLTWLRGLIGARLALLGRSGGW